jgi:spore germination protein GerM
MYKGLIRGVLSITALVVLIIGLVACGGQAINVQPSDTDTTQSRGSKDTKLPSESEETKNLTFYYVDEKLLQILEEKQEIHFKSDEEMWLAVWKGLQTPQHEQSISIWEDMELIEISLDDQQLVINISKPENLQLGSSGEGLAIQTLINTFGQVEGVETIQLLVEGQVEESLAGHVSIDQPFSKGDLVYTGE